MPRAENIYAIDSRLKDVRDVSYGPVACVPDAKIVNYLLRPAAYSKHKQNGSLSKGGVLDPGNNSNLRND
ncbi:hypothetical protein NECAME_04620 [Necator americanus]|uniref:Uncharacterized protein n=1 Tax=Necator americanus TaxID=51031 RepID=W2SPY0_NECAM|nr:hypothetical protein NECAME_04620 [Necator americanus]ETN71588.1 hypothetical protein NECAME_04620 [Necator americanus]